MPTIVNLPLPVQLQNGTPADATEVMTDLNYLASQINANSQTPGTAAVTSTSTLTSYLANLFVAGSGITITVLNPSGAAQLQITSDAADVQLAQIQAAACSI